MRCEIKDAQIGLYSFGRLQGNSPSSLRYSINCSNLRDPQGHKNLTKLYGDGRAPEIMKWIKDGDDRVPAIIETVILAAELAIDGAGETYVTIGLWDHQGRWIAPAITELVADALDAKDFRVHVKHYGIGGV